MTKTRKGYVKLSKFKLNERNPREISKDAFVKLCKSIRQFPKMMAIRGIVVDEQGLIIGGTQRYRACVANGMTDVPKEWILYAKDFSDEERRRFIIADNAPGGLSGDWNMDLLANEWDIDELIGAGFDEGELIGFDNKDDPADAEPQVDKAEELNKVWKVKRGDMWSIGEHFLMCADSTKPDDVRWLLGGQKADCTVTDPPYGVGVTYQEFKDTSENVKALIQNVMPVILDNIPAAVVSGVASMWLYPRPAWVGAWVHPAAMNTGPWGFNGNNPILYYGKDPYLQAGKGSHPDSVVMVADRQGVDGHPTPKPLKVWEWLIERMTVEIGKTVFDPFLGSGTTMVACENTGRKCRGIEISPAYCAVDLQRMTDAFQGIKIAKVK